MPAAKATKRKSTEPEKQVLVRVKKGCKGFDGLQLRVEGEEFLIDVSSLKPEGAPGTKDTDTVEVGKSEEGRGIRYSLGTWLEDAKKPAPKKLVEDEDEDDRTVRSGQHGATEDVI